MRFTVHILRAVMHVEKPSFICLCCAHPYISKRCLEKSSFSRYVPGGKTSKKT